MNSPQLLQHVQAHIQANQLLAPTEKVLVAISGGPDSVFLAWSLKTLGYDIGLAHVNYQLRGEDSEREEELVKEYGITWEVPCYIKRVAVREKLDNSDRSLQMLTRDIRYEFFEELLSEKSYSVCATAHHADDQLETLLMSMIKGNSFAFLSPIPVKRGPYIRPLLSLHKSDILEGLAQENLSYSIDYTNAENLYQRNRTRNLLIPEIETLNPGFRSHFLHRSNWYARQMGLLHKLLDELYNSYAEENSLQNVCNLEKMRKDSHYAEYEDVFLGYCLMKWGIHGHTFQEGLKLREALAGKQVPVNTDMRLYRIHSGILFDKALPNEPVYLTLESEEDLPWERRINDFFIYVIKNNTVIEEFQPNILYVDSAKVFYPLVFRSWKEGDKMVPLGMRHPKKLSDIFIDEKFSRPDKYRAVVIESAGEIIGLSGFRIADSVKVDFRTQAVLEIHIQAQENK